ncbi:MAG: phosphatidylinositol mannoside acyltransferase [Acidimicrobiales bacterium]
MPDARARFTYLAYRGVGETLSRIPAPISAVAGRMAAAGLASLPSGAGDMYLRHLERVVRRRLGPIDRRRALRRAYSAYARYWVEGARLASIPRHVVDAHMTMERGWDGFVDAMARGRGVVMALPHVGSWEWGGAFLANQGYPMTAVAEVLEPPELYDWFVRAREQLGLTIVPLGPSASTVLLSTLRNGGLVGLLCDRDIGGGGVEVEFFGERTTLPGGPATLALRTGAALIPAAVYSGPGSMHTAVILDPLDTTRTKSLRADVTRVTQAVAYELEGLIRRAPEQWHVFQPNWPSDPGWGPPQALT